MSKHNLCVRFILFRFEKENKLSQKYKVPQTLHPVLYSKGFLQHKLTSYTVKGIVNKQEFDT